MAERERSSEDIRRNIAREEENLSQTVEQIGVRIKKKLDWRTQVNDSPYWALGAATGLGYVTSKVFTRRATSMERILGSFADELRSSLGCPPAAAVRPGLIRMALLSIATKSAANWIRKECRLDSGSYGDATSQPKTGRNSNIDRETTK